MLLIGIAANAQTASHTFAFGDESFLLDGKPFQMISGEMHYPRIPREAWRARMKMAKAMGLNSIGTYVFWNVHEPQKGKFDFSGNNDIVAFVKAAQQEGLWVILRPSPYVCAEWEFGGYPYWLLNEKGLQVRSKESQYIKEYETYIKEVGKRLAPLQVNHGGNILMVQIENEYGSYGADKEYLALNERIFKQAGFDGLLFTCDPAKDLVQGHLPGMLPAVNGLDDPAKVKQLIRENHNGKGPFYIAEWYPAWFDWWGTPHHTVPAAQYAGKLDSVLAAGISINMYMFHGGTTRAFMNGANYSDGKAYEPQISSYDYDAPLDEAGNATPKFMAFRNVIQKHLAPGVQLPPVPPAKPAIKVSAIPLNTSWGMLDKLPKPVTSKRPLTFEALGQDYGFVLYRTTVTGNRKCTLKLKELRDYAVVMINGKIAGTIDRRLGKDSIELVLPKAKVQLDILVENLGRINFGKYLLDNNKGITQKVLLNGEDVYNWQMFGLPLAVAPKYVGGAKKPGLGGPLLKSGSFELQEVGDTYLDMQNWGKGMAWLNGHNLGKYWSVGPQQTLYVPAEWLKKGKNELTILELSGRGHSTVQMLDKPILDMVK